jgi:hypothetical protein
MNAETKSVKIRPRPISIILLDQISLRNISIYSLKRTIAWRLHTGMIEAAALRTFIEA